MGAGSTKYFSQDANGANKFTGYQIPVHKTETNQSHNTTGVEQEPSIDIFKDDDQTENVASDDRSTDSSVFLAESQETLLDLEESEENGNEGVAPGGSDASVSLVDASSRTDISRRKKTFNPLPSLFRRERRDKRGSNASRTDSVDPRGSTVSRGSMVVRRRCVGRGGLASSTISAQGGDGNKNRFSKPIDASGPDNQQIAQARCRKPQRSVYFTRIAAIISTGRFDCSLMPCLTFPG